MKSKNTSSKRSITEKKYSVILADPPWDVQQKGAYGAERHYSLMSLERIKALPVEDLATDDAHLWLWVTNATLREGYDVMESWGFTPRSPLTWIKPRFTLGVYLRNATEHLILGMSAVIENCTLAVTRIAYGRPSLLHTLPHIAVSGFCG